MPKKVGEIIWCESYLSFFDINTWINWVVSMIMAVNVSHVLIWLNLILGVRRFCESRYTVQSGWPDDHTLQASLEVSYAIVSRDSRHIWHILGGNYRALLYVQIVDIENTLCNKWAIFDQNSWNRFYDSYIQTLSYRNNERKKFRNIVKICIHTKFKISHTARTTERRHSKKKKHFCGLGRFQYEYIHQKYNVDFDISKTVFLCDKVQKSALIW